VVQKNVWQRVTMRVQQYKGISVWLDTTRVLRRGCKAGVDWGLQEAFRMRPTLRHGTAEAAGAEKEAHLTVPPLSSRSKRSASDGTVPAPSAEPVASANPVQIRGLTVSMGGFFGPLAASSAENDEEMDADTYGCGKRLEQMGFPVGVSVWAARLANGDLQEAAVRARQHQTMLVTLSEQRTARTLAFLGYPLAPTYARSPTSTSDVD
jgi:hypothetical protein